MLIMVDVRRFGTIHPSEVTTHLRLAINSVGFQRFWWQWAGWARSPETGRFLVGSSTGGIYFTSLGTSPTSAPAWHDLVVSPTVRSFSKPVRGQART
jgi:hypothetical protein